MLGKGVPTGGTHVLGAHRARVAAQDIRGHPNISSETIARPTANGLNVGIRKTSDSQCRGTTNAKRMSV